METKSCATGAANRPTLLCCDWGTSTFRLCLVDVLSREVVHEVRSDEGIAATYATWTTSSDDRLAVYRRVLAKHISRITNATGHSLNGVLVMLSGMASSSIGMVELPYAELPFGVDGSAAIVRQLPQTDDFPHDVLLISGARTERDVMRGEETQVVGLYSLLSDERSAGGEILLILPGTHSKHIRVSEGTITDFRTYMTGELFALLTQHSILRDSVNQPENSGIAEANWIWFRRGVRDAVSTNLLNSLFGVRVNQLIGQTDRQQNYAWLSGLLIGSELQDLVRQPPQSLVLCSGSNLFPFYEQALHELGLPFRGIPAAIMEKTAVAGQITVFNQRSQYTLANRGSR